MEQGKRFVFSGNLFLAFGLILIMLMLTQQGGMIRWKKLKKLSKGNEH